MGVMGNGSSISPIQREKINKQIQKSLCKIKINNKIKSTAFFCYIPHPDEKNLLPVIIATNYAFTPNDITLDSKIEIIIKNGKESFNLNMNEDRKICPDPDFGITIIEIKENESKENKFLYIDEDINDDNLNDDYKDIYLMYYSKDNKEKFVEGNNIKIGDRGKCIEFETKIDEEIQSGPIMNLANFRVIGIYNREKDKNNSKKGQFILESINNFNKNENSIYNFFKEIDDTEPDEIKIIYDVHNYNKKRHI